MEEGSLSSPAKGQDVRAAGRGERPSSSEGFSFTHSQGSGGCGERHWLWGEAHEKFLF